MSCKLDKFHKTDHFIYRQWDRGISDKLLSTILNSISTNRKGTLVIVSRNILKKSGVKIKKELFIKIDENTLITCFYSDFQDYINSKRVQDFLIIN